MTRVAAEAALVLHARPYRETSAIVSLLTSSHGRVPVVARGVRASKRGNVLQPFNRVRVSWSGRGSLYTLTSCELTRHVWLTGNALAAGFYVLELISRLLPERATAPEIFVGACWAIEHLEAGEPPADVVLRVFEKRLLEELGYGLDFSRDADSGEPIRADREYLLHPDSGFVAAAPAGNSEGNDRAIRHGYSGAVLMDIAADAYTARAARVAARKIFRQALAVLLGDKPLASRGLLERG
jgi:DNA repair protein RecO (recombination protein O)